MNPTSLPELSKPCKAFNNLRKTNILKTIFLNDPTNTSRLFAVEHTGGLFLIVIVSNCPLLFPIISYDFLLSLISPYYFLFSFSGTIKNEHTVRSAVSGMIIIIIDPGLLPYIALLQPYIALLQPYIALYSLIIALYSLIIALLLPFIAQ